MAAVIFSWLSRNSGLCLVIFLMLVVAFKEHRITRLESQISHLEQVHADMESRLSTQNTAQKAVHHAIQKTSSAIKAQGKLDRSNVSDDAVYQWLHEQAQSSTAHP